MEDMSNKSDEWKALLEVALEAKGSRPVVMDMSAQCSWGDYMMLVSASSQMHMKGIYHRLADFVKSHEEYEMINHPGTKDENRWILMDLGAIVIHIMTEEAREYYNLEDIWFESPVLLKEEDYSSSSS